VTQAQTAKTAQDKEEQPNWVPGTEPQKGQLVKIHVLEDGLTAFSKVWYRGQEIELVVGSKDWQDTLDPVTGKSWIDATPAEAAKRMRGIRYWDHGPWPFEDWEDPKAKKAEDERRRRSGLQPSRP
jgi:hypothetical protein